MQKNEKTHVKKKRLRTARTINSLNVILQDREFDKKDLLKYIPYRVSKNPHLRVESERVLLDSIREPTKTDHILRMIELELFRPPWVAVEVWEEHIPVSNEERIVAYLFAMGLNEAEVIQETGLSLTRVRLLGTYKRVTKKIDEIHDREFSKNPLTYMKKIEKILPEAIETAYNLMTDKAVKPAVRLAAAESFIDRVLGKSTQRIEVRDSTVRDVLKKIDDLVQKEKGEIKTIELKKEEIVCEEVNADPIEAWVAKNQI